MVWLDSDLTVDMQWQTACFCCAFSLSPEWGCLPFLQVGEFPAQALLMAYGMEV